MAVENDDLPQELDLQNLQVRELLGESGSACFWKAVQNGQEITLKILCPGTKSAPAKLLAAMARDGSYRAPPEELSNKLFLREAGLAMQLSHTNIIKCFGVAQLPGGFIPGQTAPALAMALELCEPQTVRELIIRGMAAGGRRVYKVMEAYKWLLQLSSALAYLHSRKPAIIHHNIRADSILLRRSHVDGSSHMDCVLADLSLHAVLHNDRSNTLRRRAFTQTHFNPLADSSITSGSVGGGRIYGGLAATSQSLSSVIEGKGDELDKAAGNASPTGAVNPSHGAAILQSESITPQETVAAVPRAQVAMEQSKSSLAWGLGSLESLLKQLGISELMPLQPVEMEWIYRMPDKAESFMYMAPEVFNNHPATDRSDVYSFGVLMYEMLAGDVLSISIFNTARATRMGISDAPGYALRVAEGYRPPRVQKVSDAAWYLIESCWHPDPAQRPAMDKVQAGLQKLLREAEAGGGTANSSPPWLSLKGSGSAKHKTADSNCLGCTQQCVIC